MTTLTSAASIPHWVLASVAGAGLVESRWSTATMAAVVSSAGQLSLPAMMATLP